MKALYNIHHKAKPALLLMVVVVIILGSSFLEKRLMKDMNTSISSIYKDRLIPAGELFQINDLMYSKRQVLDRYLAEPSAAHRKYANKELAAYTTQINAAIKKFETTYLVDEESKSLREFKERMNRYNVLEKELLAKPSGLIVASTEKEITWAFKNIHQELIVLNNIQIKVGEELLHSSETMKNNASLLSNLQIAIVLIITLMVQQALLLDAHPLVPKNLKDFRLN